MKTVLSKINLFFSPGNKRTLSGTTGMIVKIFSFLLGLFAIYANTIAYVDYTLQMHIFYGGLLTLSFLLFTPMAGFDKTKVPWYDWAMAIISLLATAHYVINFTYFSKRLSGLDPLSTLDMISSMCIIILSIEAIRRVLGKMMLIVTMIFLLYGFIGPYLPGTFRHSLKGFSRIVDTLLYTGSGVFNSSMQVVGSYVFLFTLFGALFSLSGAGEFFNQFAVKLTGKSKGGSAKVSVISAALFGSISGSPSANTLTTGAFVAPLMRKTGYEESYNGAVIAVSATGGAILPPMMGTAALLMVELAGIPYVQICLAAVVPALLYYGSIFFSVHIHSSKVGIGASNSIASKQWKELLQRIYFFAPLVLIVVLLATGWTTTRTATLACIAVIICSWFRKENRLMPKHIFNAIADSIRSVALIGVSCFSVGCVILGLVATGKSGQISSLIFRIGGSHLLPALAIAAILVIILGMGMPIAPAYMLAAVFAVPTLISLGLDKMTAHLFTVYFATFSAITPPVAVAAFAAASLTDASSSKIGWRAVKLGLAAFIVPFSFSLNQEMLSFNYLSASYWVVVLSCFLGMMLAMLAIEGFWTRKIPWWLRIIFAILTICIMFDVARIINVIGAVIMLLFIIYGIVYSVLKKKNPELKFIL